MDPSIGRAGINIGLFLAVTGGVLLIFQERGTAEFLITAFTTLLGLLFTAAMVLVVKLSNR